MLIRKANPNDLRQIANVHEECFVDSFSTMLGQNLIVEMYREYIKESPELFVVAEEEKKIVGFAMGYYYNQEDCLIRFRKKNSIRIGLSVIKLLIVGKKTAWKKLYSSFCKSSQFRTVDSLIDSYKKDEMGDLLSICVMNSYRGRGVANRLIQYYENILKSQSRCICTLTVADNNARGIAFYEKNGYKIGRMAKGCKTYYKILQGTTENE